MPPVTDYPRPRSCPFGADLSLTDLLLMARVELEEAKHRLLASAELLDLSRPFGGDANLALVTFKDEADALELVRHDYAHILAEAVQNLFPGTQITFGPATDDGFYYDFAPKDRPFTDDDLPAIEEEMRRIIRADQPLSRINFWSIRLLSLTNLAVCVEPNIRKAPLS